jgi:hypothetical protein
VGSQLHHGDQVHKVDRHHYCDPKTLQLGSASAQHCQQRGLVIVFFDYSTVELAADTILQKLICG